MSSNNIDEDDIKSTFSSEEGKPTTFNLTHLEVLVSQDIGRMCTLRKLAEGGYHKVYDVIVPGENIVRTVVRVAAPDFLVDKLESEVATLKYIAAHTSLPVPKVLAWSSDSSNIAGVEWPACAYDVWKTLKVEAKETLVRDVARFKLALLSLRFSKIGSPYMNGDKTFEVGPVVASPFYITDKGEARFAGLEPMDLTCFRDPFTKTSEYLSSLVQAELYVIKHRREGLIEHLDGDEESLNTGERALEKVLDLVKVYPGDLPVGITASSDGKPAFTLKLNDFALPNIMVDVDTGKVLGLIDFEAARTAPLWWCARYPWWLREDEAENSVEKAELLHLQGVFCDMIKRSGTPGEEFTAADEQGEWFRHMADRLSGQNCVLEWADVHYEGWVRERLEFAAKYPGMALRERTIEEDFENRYGAGTAYNLKLPEGDSSA